MSMSVRGRTALGEFCALDLVTLKVLWMCWLLGVFFSPQVNCLNGECCLQSTPFSGILVAACWETAFQDSEMLAVKFQNLPVENTDRSSFCPLKKFFWVDPAGI